MYQISSLVLPHRASRLPNIRGWPIWQVPLEARGRNNAGILVQGTVFLQRLRRGSWTIVHEYLFFASYNIEPRWMFENVRLSGVSTL